MDVLVVRDAFGDYAKGQMITDPAEISAVKEAGQAHFCTPTTVDDSFFAPDAPAKPAKAAAAADPAAGA